MARTKARIGMGTTLEIALAATPNTFVLIDETTSHKPPSFKDSTEQATHMQSPGGMHEFIPGVSDPGSSSHEMNFIPGSPTDVFLLGLRGKELIARLTWPNGVAIVYNCIREEYDRNTPGEGKMTATLSLKVSGAPTLLPIAAPRNLLLPAVSGVPKVGVPLTVDPGVWAGASDLTFQWRVAGIDAAGATGQAYVPIAADATKTVVCRVTGANASFNVTADSAATTAVAA